MLAAIVRPGIRRVRVTRRELPLLVAYGLTGFFFVPMLYFVAISHLPVGIALLFEYMAPLLVALWARFGQRQKVKSRLWYGLALSLAGLACVAEVWHGSLQLSGIGVAAGLGAAVLLCFYYVLGAKGVTRRDTISLTWWAFGISALAGLIVAGFRAASGSTSFFPVRALRHVVARRTRLDVDHLPRARRIRRLLPAGRGRAAAPARRPASASSAWSSR